MGPEARSPGDGEKAMRYLGGRLGRTGSGA